MPRFVGLAAILAPLIALAIGLPFTIAQEEGGEAPAKHTVKEVMKLAHKDGLLKKITDGEGEQKDKEQLLALYVDMWDAEPSKGSIESWRKLTGDAIVAAARVVVGKDGSIAELKTRTNCANCHKAHKGS